MVGYRFWVWVLGVGFGCGCWVWVLGVRTLMRFEVTMYWYILCCIGASLRITIRPYSCMGLDLNITDEALSLFVYKPAICGR